MKYSTICQIRLISSFNRTKVELKYFQVVNRFIKRKTFNRTKVELKLRRVNNSQIKLFAFNRTKVELKLNKNDRICFTVSLSTEPKWNWNLLTKEDIDDLANFQPNQSGIEMQFQGQPA